MKKGKITFSFHFFIKKHIPTANKIEPFTHHPSPNKKQPFTQESGRFLNRVNYQNNFTKSRKNYIFGKYSLTIWS